MAESDFDQSDALFNISGSVPTVTLPLEVIHTFNAPGTAVLPCNPRGIATHFGFAKLIAVRLSSASWHVSS